MLNPESLEENKEQKQQLNFENYIIQGKWYVRQNFKFPPEQDIKSTSEIIIQKKKEINVETSKDIGCKCILI